MKRNLITAWLLCLFMIMIAIFWYADWRYSRPTPVPADYIPVKNGQYVTLPQTLNTYRHHALFLHFFNPDCPCSRFNIQTVRGLADEYGASVDFAIVVMSDKQFTVKEIQNKFGLDVPVLFDRSLAKSCGVYSTPQAVLLDQDHRLYYRGNYNASRYCIDDQTSYARIALDGMLRNNHSLAFGRLALQAYGCSLPGCRN